MRIKYEVSCKPLTLGVAGCGVLLALTTIPAVANTLQTSGFLADDFMSKLNSWVWNVVLPLAFTGGIGFLVYSFFSGRSLGGWVAKVVAIAFIVGGGLPWVSSQLGINLAWGAERAPVVRAADAPAGQPGQD